MSRREFPRAVKIAAYERAGGHCETCTAPLYPGKFHYDHITPDARGGEPKLSNCAVLCVNCHGVKTRTQDIPGAAKDKRVRARHIGAEPKREKPRYRRKFDGTVVRREARD